MLHLPMGAGRRGLPVPVSRLSPVPGSLVSSHSPAPDLPRPPLLQPPGPSSRHQGLSRPRPASTTATEPQSTVIPGAQPPLSPQNSPLQGFKRSFEPRRPLVGIDEKAPPVTGAGGATGRTDRIRTCDLYHPKVGIGMYKSSCGNLME